MPSNVRTLWFPFPLFTLYIRYRAPFLPHSAPAPRGIASSRCLWSLTSVPIMVCSGSLTRKDARRIDTKDQHQQPPRKWEDKTRSKNRLMRIMGSYERFPPHHPLHRWHTHKHTYTYKHTHTNTHIHTHTNTHTRTHPHTCMHLNMNQYKLLYKNKLPTKACYSDSRHTTCIYVHSNLHYIYEVAGAGPRKYQLCHHSPVI